MHIVENKNAKAGRTYCYACECIWDKNLKKYIKPRISIGHIEGEPPSFVPNSFLAQLLGKIPAATSEQERMLITAVIAKYGKGVTKLAKINETTKEISPFQTAIAIFNGPSLIFGEITKKYDIDSSLHKAFGDHTGKDILSLAWYMASEGSALNNSDVWLNQFENPRGHSISSQDITRLLDRMNEDGILTFYKEWLSSIEKKSGDRVLYDLTSISWTGHKGVNMAGWGHNRDKEELPQVNYALLCTRSTAMPLFAWPLDGSVSDTRTLQNTLQFLEKLGYQPDCLMMDRGFASQENISYLLTHGHTFLQALRVNAIWIREIIDAGRLDRLHPNSMIKTQNRTYYASSHRCQWVTLQRTSKKGVIKEEILVYQQNTEKNEKYTCTEENVNIISQYPCQVHVLYCQDLVGGQWDRFMGSLKNEYERLLADEETLPKEELKRYFKIKKEKHARHRTIEFDIESIEKHRDRYTGFICFITNDKTIRTAEKALSEYSTRDYIEKDFDEMKNDLDMKRIRVHTDNRMCSRLLIQFISEIFIREIRVCLRDSEECKKMSRRQISAHIKGIYKIHFKEKYKDVVPELSKSQRAILEALKISDNR
jgi:transposase